MSKLIVNNLSCQRGYKLLFENLSFELNSGEVLKVSGPNGSGKTSLMKILAGLSSFETGSIDYDDTKINSERYNLDFLYLGHLAALSPELSCLENLKYTMRLGNDNLDLDFSDALKKVGLEKFENELVGKLSAGQKKRIALSLLFITQSKVWLLDEPFSALDSKAIKIIETRVEDHCNSGGICILTTHQECNIKNMKEISL
ncbi:heme ABC transporter ATP-binding protein [Candidatus Pseudothioglobus singularis]|jgi:heme exporter protein A|uniref:cytochrome c biogenesis heme-transporting ATPase CcmA n=1 Tax=Candidatus Pseudothioglobus singularis TaxID=1427364 RepID=UPI0008063427|nr:cytochrome c biogenesis heme-transporting ATPase CcmA [Candidatus Pseudothioglobus singularis]ANQ66273.1 heme ABC transporter ATP-binding protein [Candidatus Pseudothioglobus singularis]MDC3262145.1 cytochrome c biogenesis heme-transporting ATPase CcmA [Candidatus Pseudothioglobus singularis]MDG1167400.1 cytochrome c biogenesis heme-transporting ATPase CcmA [Candidatus Thioglobus sp.]|tara:strand:- start:1247 stop:1849 length:603 start_codon:yes stop_codon:yes gene_type:complete